MTRVDNAASSSDWPLAAEKDYAAAPEFQPANLSREARRPKDLPDLPVP